MGKRRMHTSLKFRSAIALEQGKDLDGALALYKKVSRAEPLHANAWNRQMVILRKQKKIVQELQLIRKAISSYEKAAESQQQAWIGRNRTKVQHSRELAATLGLLDKNGLPRHEDLAVTAWRRRLRLLAERYQKQQLIRQK